MNGPQDVADAVVRIPRDFEALRPQRPAECGAATNHEYWQTPERPMKKTEGHGATPGLESQVAAELKSLLGEIPVGTAFGVESSADFCFSLEMFIPELLRRRYPQWDLESLDGIFVACARKTGPAAAQLAGTCILISDQTVTPFLVDLEASLADDSITSFRVSLGEPGGGALGISGPECNSREAEVLLATIADRIADITWSFEISSDPP